jgi:hypothetical protein
VVLGLLTATLLICHLGDNCESLTSQISETTSSLHELPGKVRTACLRKSGTGSDV